MAQRETAGRHALLGLWPSLDLLLLTWAAGTMDAVSFIRAHVFVANMTGNTVILGLGFAPAWRHDLLPAAVSLASFALGTVFAGLLLIKRAASKTWSADLRIGLGLELPLVCVYAALWAFTPLPAPKWNSLLLVAIAAVGMGIQSVAVRRQKVSGVVTTFITGTITTAMLSFVRRDQPEGHTDAPGSTPVLISMFLSYVCAAGVAAMCGGTHRLPTALLPLLILGIVEFRAIRARQMEHG